MNAISEAEPSIVCPPVQHSVLGSAAKIAGKNVEFVECVCASEVAVSGWTQEKALSRWAVIGMNRMSLKSTTVNRVL